MDSQKVKLSVLFKSIAQECKKTDFNLHQLIHILGSRSHFLISFFFACPFLLPIPLPGLSTAFGIVIFLMGFQILFGQELWLPKSWERKQISKELLEKVFTKASKIIAIAEKVTKARMQPLIRARWISKINGTVFMYFAILLALPMPPGFNAPPALGICILALGLLEKDGVAVLISWFIALLNAVIFGLFFFFGVQGLERVFKS